MPSTHELSEAYRFWEILRNTPDSVRFGARKRSNHDAVGDWVDSFRTITTALVRHTISDPENTYECLLSAIMVDQQCRNWMAVCEDIPEDVAAGFFGCALSLARRGVVCLDDATCEDVDPHAVLFGSLVFRHSDVLEDVDTAVSLLERGTRGELAAAKLDPNDALVRSMLRHSRDKAALLRQRCYIARALSSDVPDLDWDPASPDRFEPLSGLEPLALDVLCRRGDNPDSYLGTWQECLDHPTVRAMETVLVEDGVDADHSLVVSLSGGVDSTAHLVALRLLQPKFGFGLTAVHIDRINREDSKHERVWVQLIARKLGIKLFSYKIELRRPRGEDAEGIGRDEYERVTQRIRFRMYGIVADRAGTPNTRIVIGHHKDDVDENRLAELGKGNIVDIDGMAPLMEMHGVTVWRPLVRRLCKEAMYSLARAAGIPFVVNSTPRWCRRGSIRAALDDHPDTARALLPLLTTLGDASAKLSRLLLPGRVRIERGVGGDASFDVVVIVVEAMRSNPGLQEAYDDVMSMVKRVAKLWNPLVCEDTSTTSLQCIAVPVVNLAVFCFLRAVKAVLANDEIRNIIGRRPVSNRALLDLFRTEGTRWHTINKECACVWLPEQHTLALYPGQFESGMASSGRRRIEFISKILGES